MAHVHKYNKEVVAPTYTSEGYTIFTCDCGDSYTTGNRPALKIPKVSGMRGVCTQDSITVQWNDVKDSEGYMVTFVDENGVKSEWFTKEPKAEFTHLTPQTAYTFEIKVCIGGTVGETVIRSFTTAKFVVKPMYNDISEKEATEHSLTFSWKAVDYAEYYVIDRYYPDKKNKIAVVYANEKLEFTDSDLYSGINYIYNITAYKGNIEVGKGSIQIYTKAEDFRITGCKQTDRTDTTIDVQWNMNAHSGGYLATISGAGLSKSIEITDPAITSCTFTDLVPDKVYMIVIACLGDINRDFKTGYEGRTAAGKVKNLRINKVGENYVGILFDKQNNANTYEVDILINGVWKSYDWRRINYLAGLESKTTYDLRVRSISGDFKSEYEYLTFTTL